VEGHCNIATSVNLGYDDDDTDYMKLYITHEMNMENKYMVEKKHIVLKELR
jgi:uncharacterized linocin/CFP29 family protein